MNIGIPEKYLAQLLWLDPNDKISKKAHLSNQLLKIVQLCHQKLQKWKIRSLNEPYIKKVDTFNKQIEKKINAKDQIPLLIS